MPLKEALRFQCREALMEEGEVKFNTRIPENLRDAFQEVCESEGRSM